MKLFCRAAALAVCLFATAGAAPLVAADPMDWPNWRGPHHNGISYEVGLVDSFDPESGENLLWKRDDLPTRSTPIAMNGKLYFLARAEPGTKKEGERVVCIDAVTGKDVWETKFGVYLSEVPDTRVAWSNVCGDPETGNIYAQGVCGLFMCLDGETGKNIWSRSLHEEFGLLSTYGGRTNVPVVFEDTVIIGAVIVGWREMAVPSHRLICFDKKTGEARWITGTALSPPDTTYSTPVICKLNGEDALVFGSSDGAVHAFQPRTGKPIWKFGLSRRGVNVTPVVQDNVVYMSHGEEQWADSDATMGAVVAIDGALQGDITGKGAKWIQREVMNVRTTPVVIGDKLYQFDDRAGLWIFDAKTGKQPFNKGPRPKYEMKIGRGMFGSPLYADGKIYACSTSGDFWILKPDDNEKTGVKVVQRQVRLNTEVNASPIVSHGRIYLATDDGIYCIGNKDQQPKLGDVPAEEARAEPPRDEQPAQLQIVPAEAMLAPGESQQFTIRAYNAAGQFLGASKAEFSVDRGGNVTADGKYTADKDYTHQASTITAQSGDLTAVARVRVVGDFPWSFDFANGRVPEVWVGMRNRHIVVDFDLANTLRTSDPLAHQLYLYFGKAFLDSGKSSLSYTETTKPIPFSSILKFLGVHGQIQTLDEAKAHFNEALDQLVAEKVLASYVWLGEGKDGLGLSVEKGSRAIDNAVMVKLDRIPTPNGFTQLGTRSQGWMGPIHFHDYTIEGDFYATEKGGKLPDMGLNNQRYQVELNGASQHLEIRTWFAQKRMAQSVPYSWKPYTWYRIKMRSENKNDIVVLKAKVWPKDAEEPAEWTLTAEDPAPERIGAPGFWGNAKDTEFFIDNISVYQNK